ncbi:hypothetical protein CHS0354_002993 [Potamilus streckersoni]|uniref:TLC domain-containing protein n=1 Tax=Potamilus streckersoni TaxID=2493646 RepID=A0AAE0VJ19_9BIVA|nr:hypothetical protein CHS0354_002993 [Potamilus streckersoni]
MMGLVEYLHPALEHVNYKRSDAKLAVIGASFVFFSALCVVSAVLSTLSYTYRNLRKKEKLFWNLAIVRGAYGIFGTVFGLWAIFIDTELIKDVVNATTPTSYFALAVTVGFFIFECSALLASDIIYKQFSFLLNLHHWLSLVGYSLLMVMDSPHYFGTCGLILEMSTPFSCICWTLLKTGSAHTLLWKANQFILVHLFHLRSVVECFLWYKTYQNWTRVWEAMPLPMFLALYIQLALVTLVMTPYWTYKKTIQMINPVDWNFEDSEKNKTKNGSAKKDN